MKVAALFVDPNVEQGRFGDTNREAARNLPRPIAYALSQTEVGVG